jgi:hypothetical protein
MTEQKPVAPAVPEDKVLSYTDLRIIPEGYEIPEDSNSPLAHADLRIVEVKSKRES